MNTNCTFTNFTISHDSSTFPSSGAHTLLDTSSKPTLNELDRLIVGLICSDWEQMALHLGVESSVIDTARGDNPDQYVEACRGVLNRWLKAEPGTGNKERTWNSVLEALVTSGQRQLAERLKDEHFVQSSEVSISELTSLPGMCMGTWPTQSTCRTSLTTVSCLLVLA